MANAGSSKRNPKLLAVLLGILVVGVAVAAWRWMAASKPEPVDPAAAAQEAAIDEAVRREGLDVPPPPDEDVDMTPATSRGPRQVGG